MCHILALVGLAAAEPTLNAPGRAVRVDVGSHLVFALDWRVPIVRTGFSRQVNASFGRPAVAAVLGLVIVGTGEGDVVALRLHDGSVAWTYHHGEPFEGAAEIFALVRGPNVPPTSIVVLGSRDGTLLALDAGTGGVVWKTNIDGDARAPAVQSNGVLVVETANNQVHTLELSSGKILWHAGRSLSSGLTITGHAAPWVADGVVYAAFSDGYVEAYGLSDGTRQWSRPLSVKGGEFADADADPVLAAGRLFVASYSDGIYALDPATGRTLWNQPAAAVRSLGLYGSNVIAGSADGSIWALSQQDGTPQFRTRVPQGLATRMIVRNDLIVLGGGTGGLMVLRAATGQPLQSTMFGTRLDSDPAWNGEQLAMVSSNGFVYAFSHGSSGRFR